jgi:hypothetical protein
LETFEVFVFAGRFTAIDAGQNSDAVGDDGGKILGVRLSSPQRLDLILYLIYTHHSECVLATVLASRLGVRAAWLYSNPSKHIQLNIMNLQGGVKFPTGGILF